MAAAGAESAARRPVTAGPSVPPRPPVHRPPRLEGTEVHRYVWWGIRIGQYVMAGMLVLGVLLAASWAHKTLAYAQVGRGACDAGPIFMPSDYTCKMSAEECFMDQREILLLSLRDMSSAHNRSLVKCASAEGFL